MQTIFPCHHLICCSRPDRKGMKATWPSCPPEAGAIQGPGKGWAAERRSPGLIIPPPVSLLSPSHLGSEGTGHRDQLVLVKSTGSGVGHPRFKLSLYVLQRRDLGHVTKLRASLSSLILRDEHRSKLERSKLDRSQYLTDAIAVSGKWVEWRLRLVQSTQKALRQYLLYYLGLCILLFHRHGRNHYPILQLVAEAEAPIFWPSEAKNWLIGKDLDAGKDWGKEEKGVTEKVMVGWHRWLNGHESEQTPEDIGRQRSLACCGWWDRKESDMTEWLNSNNIWWTGGTIKSSLLPENMRQSWSSSSGHLSSSLRPSRLTPDLSEITVGKSPPSYGSQSTS